MIMKQHPQALLTFDQVLKFHYGDPWLFGHYNLHSTIMMRLLNSFHLYRFLVKYLFTLGLETLSQNTTLYNQENKPLKHFLPTKINSPAASKRSLHYCLKDHTKLNKWYRDVYTSIKSIRGLFFLRQTQQKNSNNHKTQLYKLKYVKNTHCIEAVTRAFTDLSKSNCYLHC